MKADIYKDEWWPVYQVDRDPDGDHKIDANLYERHRAAQQEFLAVQIELARLWQECES